MPVLFASVSRDFEVSALVLGLLLVLAALASGVERRSPLSVTALFVVVGFVLGPAGTGTLHFVARSGFVAELATVALIVILFRDGLEVDGEMLAHHWHLPARKLGLAMPITAGIIAVAARALVGLSWTESFLLGALLSPTDPVLSSSVVTNPRVPALVRHSLNLESGLNDGLALPAVLAFAAALDVTSHGFVWWRFVLEDVAVGLAVGIAVGLIASVLMRPHAGLLEGIPAFQKALYALGSGFAAYGTAVLIPHGNGLIAVFVAAITLGIRRPDIRESFEPYAAGFVEIVKLGIFVVFGSLLTFHGLFADGWAAVAIVVVTLLVARPVAVFGALAGTGVDTATKAFMAWFGPKGVATMTFSLLVLSGHVASGRRIFNLAALVVFCSIVAHGVSDTPGAEWLARRAEGSAETEDRGDRAQPRASARGRRRSASAGQ
jgi:NhaP-type Na+/H+ or K+/H+ antiporter